MKIKLEMDRDRAIKLMQACEIIARIGMGQFKDMVELLKPEASWDECVVIENYLKAALKPSLTQNSYDSMSSVKCPESTQVAWDAYQHIRREISWRDAGKDWRVDPRNFREMGGVNFDEPFKASKLPGDFKVERVDEPEDCV